MTLVKHRSKIYRIFLGKNGGAKQSSTIGIFVNFLMWHTLLEFWEKHPNIPIEQSLVRGAMKSPKTTVAAATGNTREIGSYIFAIAYNLYASVEPRSALCASRRSRAAAPGHPFTKGLQHQGKQVARPLQCIGNRPVPRRHTTKKSVALANRTNVVRYLAEPRTFFFTIREMMVVHIRKMAKDFFIRSLGHYP